MQTSESVEMIIEVNQMRHLIREREREQERERERAREREREREWREGG